MIPPLRARAVVRQLNRSARPKGGRVGRLRLDVNERPVAFPAQVTRDLLAALDGEVLTAYPEVRPLYDDLAAHHGLTPAHLAITAGSEMAIRYLFEAFLEPGDPLVVLDPSFAMFDVYARLCGARVIAVPFQPGCTLDADAVRAAITPGVKVVAVANPNNPTGTVFSDREMRALIERAGEVGAIFLSDEAYFYFHDGTALPWIGEYPHLLVSRTFSKAWGLAGIRLGYAAGAPEVIAEIQKLQPIDHTNSLAVACGRYMLAHESIVREYARDVVAARASVAARLRALGCEVAGTAGNFLLVDAGRPPETVAAALDARGIMVGTALRLPFPHQYFRVSIGPEAVMAPFVDAMAEILR